MQTDLIEVAELTTAAAVIQNARQLRHDNAAREARLRRPRIIKPYIPAPVPAVPCNPVELLRTELEESREKIEAIQKENARLKRRLELLPEGVVTMASIAAECMLLHQVSEVDFRGEGRCVPAVRCRQHFWYRCKTEIGVSYPRMARFAGRKDHSSALHGKNKWAEIGDAYLAQLRAKR